MLVCNVSLRPPRAGIAADIAELAEAVDATATGQVVFATLVDDPASVRETVDAYLGEIMLEAASASAAVNAGLAYAAAIDEAVTAADTASATIPALADVAEAAAAASAQDGTVVSGDAWVLVNSWTFSTNVLNVAFTGLAAYSEIRVLLRNVTATVGTDSRIIHVSTNNGSSYMNSSGDYVEVDTNGVPTNRIQIDFIPGFGSGNAFSGEAMISGWNLTANKLVQVRSRTDVRQYVIPTSSALNALRVSNSLGANLTGGSIYVFGR